MAAEALPPLVARLLGDGSSYQRMLMNAQSQTRSAVGNIQGAFGAAEAQAGSGGLGGLLSGLGTAMTTVTAATVTMGAALVGVGAAAAVGFAGWGVLLAAELEQNEIAFGVMLRSAEKGKQMVQDLQAFAAVTPLETGTLVDAARTLLQFGVAGEDILPTLRMLGDATGGNAERVRMMSLAFGQMTSAGRLMGQDLLQMINAGFNPLQEIARTTGQSVADLKTQMEKGQISVQMVRDAFASATGAGGQFEGMMEKQSHTVMGLWSTLKDNFALAATDIGLAIIEAFDLRGMIRGTGDALGWFRSTLVPGIAGVVGVVGRLWQTGLELGKMFFSQIAAIYQPLWEDLTAVLGPLLEKGNGQITSFIDKAKVAFQAFLDFATPLWNAWVGVLRAAFAAVTTTVQALFGSDIVQGGVANMKSQFQSFADTVKPIIEKVRNALITAMIGAEFAFRNFPEIAELAFVTVQGHVFDLIARIQEAFQGGLPGIATFIGEVFNRIFTAVSGMVDRMAMRFIENFKRVGKNMPLLMSGVLDVKDVWAPLTDSLEVNMANLPAIADGGLRAMADQAQARQAELMGQLQPGWQDFLAKRWAEVFQPPAALGAGGGAIGAFFAHAGEIGKRGIAEGDRVWNEELKRRGEMEMGGEAEAGAGLWNRLIGDPQKILEAGKKSAEAGKKALEEAEGVKVTMPDAVLFRSAEALRRRVDFQERLRESGKPKGGGFGPNDRADVTKPILADIRDGINELVKKPALEVEPAGLG